MVEMQNGCICCTLREDLLKEITLLAREGKFDYILIESTGISEPLQVAETFTFESEEEGSIKLDDMAHLDTCVTVVDAFTFFDNMKSMEDLKDRYKDLEKDNEQSITGLLLEQIEFADVILLNKLDLISQDQAKECIKILAVLNPGAKIIPTRNSKVDLNEILNTRLFDFAKASLNPGWLKEMRGEHKPESEEYGISSFVYRSRRPFHPQRLYSLLQPKENNYIKEHFFRSKGFFWLATRYDTVGEWAQAGKILYLGSGGPWYATWTKADWKQISQRERNEILRDFKGEHGDRRNELVFIGQNYDRQKVEGLLDACLLTDDEMKQKWDDFEDEFSDWDDEGEDEEGWVEVDEHDHHGDEIRN